ncbi:MAG: CDP-alcohol phosphatidyltransferase family protein [Aggregatilineales bacterium]
MARGQSGATWSTRQSRSKTGAAHPLKPEQHADSYSAGQRAMLKVLRPALSRFISPLLRILAAWGVSPNALSLAQIPLGALMVIVIGYNRLIVIGLMLACFALDGLDGLLARSTGQANPYGALIDQMADQIREVLTVAAVAQTGALSPLVATLYGVLYPLSNVGLYLVNVRGGAVGPTFKSVLTFYPFLLIYLLGGPNWLEPAGWLTVFAMALTVGQCTWALARLGVD